MSPNNNTETDKLSATLARGRQQLNPAGVALAGCGMILWLARGRLDQALLWTGVLGLVVVYPTARFAQSRARRSGDRLEYATLYAMSAVCCAGGLAILGALGAPRAAMMLALCGLLGALATATFLSRFGRTIPVALALAVFFGGAASIYSWLGLGVLALAGLMSRGAARRARAEMIAAWLLALALAWGVYLPVLGVWEFAGFWWGFVRWLGL